MKGMSKCRQQSEKVVLQWQGKQIIMELNILIRCQFFFNSLNFVAISTHSNQTFYITKENAQQLEAIVVYLERIIESQHVEARESISY